MDRERGIERDSERDIERDSERDIEKDSERDIERDRARDIERDSEMDIERDRERERRVEQRGSTVEEEDLAREGVCQLLQRQHLRSRHESQFYAPYTSQLLQEERKHASMSGSRPLVALQTHKSTCGFNLQSSEFEVNSLGRRIVRRCRPFSGFRDWGSGFKF
jgi:hypothetical protein